MKLLLLSLLLCSAMMAHAGNYPFYYYFTQHTQNQLLYNPAYAGSTDKLNLHVRTMNGFYSRPDGKPIKPLNLEYAAFDMPCPKIHGAWGVYSIIDRPETPARFYNLSVGANYAYRLQIKDEHKLQLGLGLVYRRHYADITGLTFSFTPIPEPDPVYSSNYMDFNAGVWYQFKDLNVGVSATHFGNFYMAGQNDKFTNRYSPVFNLYGAYKVHLSKAFNLEPYLYLSTAGVGDKTRSVHGEKRYKQPLA